MKNPQKTTNFILFDIGLLLFAYTLSRAYLLSFCFDESTTYLLYVRKNFTTFKSYSFIDANNHLLNTWLMELSSRLFGFSVFALRLPNILAHLIFLFYSAKLVKNLSSFTMIIGSFLLINCCPFLLDFFSVPRSYGLSFALMMGSIYYAYKFINQKSTYLSAFLSILFASIALLAYFSFINYLLIIYKKKISKKSDGSKQNG